MNQKRKGNFEKSTLVFCEQQVLHSLKRNSIWIFEKPLKDSGFYTFLFHKIILC